MEAYLIVARCPPYNDQLRYIYFFAGNYFFRIQQYDSAPHYYEKALAYSDENISTFNKISELRKHYFYKWDARRFKDGIRYELFSAYNIATANSLLGDYSEALLWLDFSIEMGMDEWRTIKNDPTLYLLRNNRKADYEEILTRSWRAPD
jgi:tetratricopeptide (TPR) repeat protein